MSSPPRPFLARTLLSAAVTILIASSSLRSADEFRVLPENFNADKKQQMMRSYLRNLIHQRLDKRLEEIETLKTEEQLISYQKRLQSFFLQSIGGSQP